MNTLVGVIILVALVAFVVWALHKVFQQVETTNLRAAELHRESRELVWWEKKGHALDLHLASGDTWRGPIAWFRVPDGIHHAEVLGYRDYTLDTYAKRIEFDDPEILAKRRDLVEAKENALRLHHR